MSDQIYSLNITAERMLFPKINNTTSYPRVWLFPDSFFTFWCMPVQKLVEQL